MAGILIGRSLFCVCAGIRAEVVFVCSMFVMVLTEAHAPMQSGQS